MNSFLIPSGAVQDVTRQKQGETMKTSTALPGDALPILTLNIDDILRTGVSNTEQLLQSVTAMESGGSGVVAGTGDADFENAGEVHGTGEGFIAGLLVHGQ